MSAADVERVNALKRARAAIRSARSLVAQTHDSNLTELCRGEMSRLEALEDSISERFKAARAQLTGAERRERAHGAGGGHS